MKTWRLLDTARMTAAENMALDETLVEMRGEGKTPNTIHFLQFSPPAVLIGYHQSVAEEIRQDFCRSHGIHINRRVTGGGAIFFDEGQLGWEVVCDKSFFNVTFFTEKLFRLLCEPIVSALKHLGIQSRFRPRNDIEVDGRKISGTGGTESDDAFLFQGTMLTDFDVDTMLKSLRIPVEKLKAKEIDSVRERVTCLKWELGSLPPIEEIKDAIAAGFESCLGIRLQPGSLTIDEERRFREKASYFASDRWIHSVSPRIRRKETVQAAYKSDAGMVRCTLVISMPRRRITDIYLTGDFLTFPSRALFDLESQLRGAPLDSSAIQCVVRDFFEAGHIRVPGMDWPDFMKPIDSALEKIGISESGIPLEYCNRISVVNGSFDTIKAMRPPALLLPYCAKSLECDLRYEKECRSCGECNFGDAWGLGVASGMEVRTVVSFEDLIDELERLKRNGTGSFIGCCCEPFYNKHVDDFQAVGLPGILLDIDHTTCYELDQAKAAYAGTFDRETCLNLDLIRTVLDAVGQVNT